MASQREVTDKWKRQYKYLPFLMSLGIGLAVNNSRAVLEALFGEESPFERTPKYGVGQQRQAGEWVKKARSFGGKASLVSAVELAYGAYVTLCIVLCIRQGMILSFSLPFLVIFAVGYFYVGIGTLYSRWAANRGKGASGPGAEAVPASSAA
jgi:hypothetical protein